MGTATLDQPIYTTRHQRFAKIFDWPAAPKERQPTCVFCDQRGGVYATEDRYGFANTWRVCPYCAICWAEWRLTPEGYDEFYRVHYTTLANEFSPVSSDYDPRLVAQHWVSTFSRMLGQQTAGLRVLDVGGNDGLVVQGLCEHYDWHGTCIDPAAANYLHQMDTPGWRVDMQATWPSNLGRFDVIICNQTIDHFADPLGAMARIRSALTPNGVLLVNFVDHAVTQRRCAERKLLVSHTIKIDHPFNYVEQSAARLLLRSGFAIETTSALPPRFLMYKCRPV